MSCLTCTTETVTVTDQEGYLLADLQNVDAATDKTGWKMYIERPVTGASCDAEGFYLNYEDLITRRDFTYPDKTDFTDCNETGVGLGNSLPIAAATVGTDDTVNLLQNELSTSQSQYYYVQSLSDVTWDQTANAQTGVYNSTALTITHVNDTCNTQEILLRPFIDAYGAFAGGDITFDVRRYSAANGAVLTGGEAKGVDVQHGTAFSEYVQLDLQWEVYTVLPGATFTYSMRAELSVNNRAYTVADTANWHYGLMTHINTQSYAN